jgi:hypothetical protein
MIPLTRNAFIERPKHWYESQIFFSFMEKEKKKIQLYLSRYEDALIEINKLVSLDSNNIPARQLKKNIIQLGKAARVKEQQMVSSVCSIKNLSILLYNGIHLTLPTCR